MSNIPSFSIIIPVFNEESSVIEVIEKLKDYLSQQNYVYEIIAINDGSTDKSKELLQAIYGIKLINHPYNKGYGAAIKTGVKNSQYDWVLFYDSDGQHQPEYISKLLEQVEGNEMVVGERVGYKGPFIRQPGKKILHWIANYLVNQKIPDLNSGLRLVKKDLVLQFLPILPNNFSLSTTITLAFFKEGLNVKYVSITINKRKGENRSTVKMKDGLQTLLLILRVITLFNPLKVFIPASLFLLIFGTGFSIYGIVRFGRLPNSGIIIFLSGFILFFNGIFADQIAAIRRGIK